jgi:hypothetical protein
VRAIILSFLALWSVHAFSQETNDLARRSDFLNRADYMKREYDLLRSDLMKESGVNARLAEMLTRLSSWVAAWGNVKSLIDNPPAITLSEMEIRLGEVMNAQTDVFAGLQLDLLHLMLELNEMEARLGSLRPIEYRIEHYSLGDQGQNLLEKRIGELRMSVQSQSHKLADTITRINEAVKLLRVAFDAKISVVWAQKGIATLNEIMRMVDELDVATKLLAPVESSLLDSLGKYQIAYSTDRLMEAVDKGQILQKKCQSMEADVNGLAIADRYKKAAIVRFSTLCDAPARVINLIKADPGKYVASAIINKRKPRIENVCKSDMSYTMNCGLYGSISRLRKDQIQAMPVENLRQLEAIYSAIEANKRRGNIFEGLAQ